MNVIGLIIVSLVFLLWLFITIWVIRMATRFIRNVENEKQRAANDRKELLALQRETLAELKKVNDRS